MKPTNEQQAILDVFLQWKNIKINAFAWTWKSTTLKLLADAVLDKKILVLVFNNAVARELESKFPSNCVVSTIHAFALKFINTNKRKIDSDKMLLRNIRNKFDLDYPKTYIISKLLNAYFNSDEKHISLKFIVRVFKEDDKLFELFKREKLNFSQVLKILIETFKLIESWEFVLTHSYYLKYFQLNLDKYKKNINFDIVMLDEWQDTNLVTYDIFKNLSGQKVIVWDTHQWIYGWRWSYNAMEFCDFDTFYLSTSFRVNEKVAQLADFILKNYKNEKHTFKAFFKDWTKANWKECIITRKNTTIVKYVNSLSENDTINFERNINNIFKIPLEIEKIKKFYFTEKNYYLLRISGYLKDFVQENKTWDDFWNYICEKLDDMELCSAYTLANIINVYETYEKAQKLEKDYKNYIATAHSVKWKEYEKVIIKDDFKDLFLQLKKLMNDRKITAEEVYNLFYNHPKQTLIRKYVEEVNLMYVAITRTIKDLDIQSMAINNLLSITKEKFIEHLKSL